MFNDWDPLDNVEYFNEVQHPALALQQNFAAFPEIDPLALDLDAEHFYNNVQVQPDNLAFRANAVVRLPPHIARDRLDAYVANMGDIGNPEDFAIMQHPNIQLNPANANNLNEPVPIFSGTVLVRSFVNNFEHLLIFCYEAVVSDLIDAGAFNIRRPYLVRMQFRIIGVDRMHMRNVPAIQMAEFHNHTVNHDHTITFLNDEYINWARAGMIDFDGSGDLLDFEQQDVQFQFFFFGGPPYEFANEVGGEGNADEDDDVGFFDYIGGLDEDAAPGMRKKRKLDRSDVGSGNILPRRSARGETPGASSRIRSAPRKTGRRIAGNLFIQGGMDDLFYASKACVKTPDNSNGYCFAMSFLRAQCRIVEYEPNELLDVDCDVMNTIHETKNTIYDGSEFEKYLVDLGLGELYSDFIIPDFYETESSESFPWKSGQKLILFNTYKKKLSHSRNTIIRYAINETTEEGMPENFLECWRDAAIELHSYVEWRWGDSFDSTDLDTCLAAYAFVFGVHIHLFRSETGGERCDLMVPDFPLRTLNRYRTRFHVCMLLSGDHCHGITSIRNFKKDNMCMETGVYTYCDLCTDLKRCNNMTIDKAKKHASCCVKEKHFEGNGKLETFLTKKTEGKEKSIRYYPLPKKDQIEKPYCYTCCCFECGNVDHNQKPKIPYTCSRCNGELCKDDLNGHSCYMKVPKERAPLNEDKIFVYDIEACQTQYGDKNRFQHELTLLYMLPVYSTNGLCDAKEMHSMGDFMRLLQTDVRYENSIFIAHNGGGYDHQYVLKYIESNAIRHETLPCPNNPHKYILLKMFLPRNGFVLFVDFMLFVPASLKEVAISFGLNMSKGDFPHRFHTKERMDYEGALPPINTQDDFYSIQFRKDENEVQELMDWYEIEKSLWCICNDGKCRCGKPKWKLKEQLAQYCRTDVYLLANACRIYRTKALDFGDYSLDPFTFLTQSQMALHMFLRQNTFQLALIDDKIRPSFDPRSIIWLEGLMDECDRKYKICHVGNSNKEWYHTFVREYVSGFCEATNTIYDFISCDYWGCPHCHRHEIEHKTMHPTRNITYDVLNERIMHKHTEIAKGSKTLLVMRSCMFDRKQEKEKPSLKKEYMKEVSCVMKDREMFYGGRVEVFSPYADGTKKDEIKHIDVCSMYPFVCGSKEIPIDHPEIFFGVDCDMDRLSDIREDGYWGFIRCKVLPCTHDLIGLLPSHSENRLVFDLYEKIGTWHTSELYLAMERGYRILEIYEVKHWGPGARSNKVFKPYISFFMRQKLEAGGWVKLGYTDENPPEELKQSICDNIATLNNGIGIPRPEYVKKDGVAYQLAKSYLVCLWAKFGQRTEQKGSAIVTGLNEYLKVWKCPHIDRSSLKFRHINNNSYHVVYNNMDGIAPVHSHYNIYISATVTAEARCILHRKMYSIGPERILYCDTDSIIFSKGSEQEDFISMGLGGWQDEKKGQKIDYYVSVAPKTYVLSIISGEDCIKAKGVKMNIVNRQNVKFKSMLKLLEDTICGGENEFIEVDDMVIAPNSTDSNLPYATMVTRYGTKKMKVVFSKRNLVTYGDKRSINELQIKLLPWGYR